MTYKIINNSALGVVGIIPSVIITIITNNKSKSLLICPDVGDLLYGDECVNNRPWSRKLRDKKDGCGVTG